MKAIHEIKGIALSANDMKELKGGAPPALNCSNTTCSKSHQNSQGQFVSQSCVATTNAKCVCEFSGDLCTKNENPTD